MTDAYYRKRQVGNLGGLCWCQGRLRLCMRAAAAECAAELPASAHMPQQLRIGTSEDAAGSVAAMLCHPLRLIQTAGIPAAGSALLQLELRLL